MMRRVSSPVLRGVGYGDVSFLPGRPAGSVRDSLSLLYPAAYSLKGCVYIRCRREAASCCPWQRPVSNSAIASPVGCSPMLTESLAKPTGCCSCWHSGSGTCAGCCVRAGGSSSTTHSSVCQADTGFTNSHTRPSSRVSLSTTCITGVQGMRI